MAINKDYNIRLRTKGDKKAKRALGGVTSSIKSMVGTVASIYTLKKGFDATIKASVKQEKIFKRLQTSVENTGKSWDSAKGELDSMFASLQATTEFGDTDSAEMLQKLIEYTGDYEMATENMGLLLDMASTQMFNEESAARYLGQALAGNVSTLGRYIPELRTANNEQLANMDTAEKAEYAQKLLNEKFGGTAQENLKTVTGQYEQMKNYLGDIGEAIGDKALPGINGLLSSWVQLVQTDPASELEQQNQKANELTSEFENLAHQVLYLTKKEKLSKEETKLKNEAIKELQSTFPKYFNDLEGAADNYDDLKSAISGAREQLSDYTNQIIQQAIVQQYADRIAKLTTKIANHNTAIAKAKMDNDKLASSFTTTKREADTNSMAMEQNNQIIGMSKTMNKG
ncbi:MAG: hypothetical protein R6U11_04600, partial [Bacteroidales bacterium]